jgi:hypothetical protein
MSVGVGDVAVRLSEALVRRPFEPFVVVTTDGRQITVSEPGCAVLNTLALSVVEEAFSVTVVALEQVREISEQPRPA